MKNKWFRDLMSIIKVVSACFVPYKQEIKKIETKKYALLVGGGTDEYHSFESFYSNIKYVFNVLVELGYIEKDIKILFFDGKIQNHSIVEDSATKKNFIYELNRLEGIIDSNDSLLIFRSGHGMVDFYDEKYGQLFQSEDCCGTVSAMDFPDGCLNCFEFKERLNRIKAKQIILILSQCFGGQFADIVIKLPNTVVISESKETGLAFHQNRKTLRWQHSEWPFVKCFFDGFLKSESTLKKTSVFGAFQYMLECNPNIEGIPIKADRPLLKEYPMIKYGRDLKQGFVYIN